MKNKEKNITYIKEIKNTSKEYIYLFNGDVYLEEKKKRKRKKKISGTCNMLSDLEIY